MDGGFKRKKHKGLFSLEQPFVRVPNSADAGWKYTHTHSLEMVSQLPWRWNQTAGRREEIGLVAFFFLFFSFPFRCGAKRRDGRWIESCCSCRELTEGVSAPCCKPRANLISDARMWAQRTKPVSWCPHVATATAGCNQKWSFWGCVCLCAHSFHACELVEKFNRAFIYLFWWSWKKIRVFEGKPGRETVFHTISRSEPNTNNGEKEREIKRERRCGRDTPLYVCSVTFHKGCSNLEIELTTRQTEETLSQGRKKRSCRFSGNL